jgi:group I intron endonuclease
LLVELIGLGIHIVKPVRLLFFIKIDLNTQIYIILYMCDYSNSVVYAIVCKDCEIKDMYVGSTNNIDKRKICHKSNCYNVNSDHYNRKVYKFIRENGGFDNFKFQILEEVCCENKQELLERERFYVECLEPSLNIEVPSRSKKEYYQDHREEKLEYQKEYYQENQENYKKYYQDHRDKLTEKINCECGGTYTRPHKAKHFKTKKHQDYLKNLNIN